MNILNSHKVDEQNDRMKKWDEQWYKWMNILVKINDRNNDISIYAV